MRLKESCVDRKSGVLGGREIIMIRSGGAEELPTEFDSSTKEKKNKIKNRIQRTTHKRTSPREKGPMRKIKEGRNREAE